MTFALEPSDEDFVQTAPCRFVFPMRLRASAEQVWSGLVAERPLAWVRGLTIRWTSPAPFGVGTTRVAAVGFGAVRLDVVFFRWEEGRRYSFSAVGANVPAFRRFAEDFVVAADGDGCIFTWTFAFEPRGPRALAGALGAAQRPIFAAMARDTRRHFGTAAPTD